VLDRNFIVPPRLVAFNCAGGGKFFKNSRLFNCIFSAGFVSAIWSSTALVGLFSGAEFIYPLKGGQHLHIVPLLC